MLKQKFYSAVERQSYCDICSEAVTNPLCPVCLVGEIEAWLTFYPNLKKELLPKLKKYLERVEENIVDATTCIKCNKARASICPFCFMDYVEGELKNLNVIPKILEEFNQFFDFDVQVPDVHKAKWERLPLIY